MERIEEDEFIKQTVIENNKWSVYIGYKELSPLIDKFESLSNLTNERMHIAENVNRNTDLITGFLTSKGLLEKAFLEIERYKRYGNIFSVIIWQMIYIDEANNLNQSLNNYQILKGVSDLIAQSIRILDMPCIWNDNTFLIILPETNFDSTLIVIEKIKSIFENKKNIQSTLYSAELIGIENKYKDIKELVECINSYIGSL